MSGKSDLWRKNLEVAEIYGEETLKVLNSRCVKLQPFGEGSWNFGLFLKQGFQPQESVRNGPQLFNCL